MKEELYNIDVKDLLIKGDLGARETHDVKFKKDVKLDEENALKSYEGEVKLTLLEKEILAEFGINYVAETICARCLEVYKREGSLSFDREYAVGKRVAEEDELIVDKKFQIEVGGPIFEEISFDIPMKPLCREACKGIK